MLCPKCGAEVKEGYCMRCGMLVSGKLPTQMDDSVFRDQTYIEDADELEIFVGENYEKIVFNPVNFVAAFIGPFWLAYRKCYGLSILLPILEVLFLFLVHHFFKFPFFIYILFHFFFYLMATNKMYVMHAHHVIKKIKKKHLDYYTLLEKKGGVSVWFPFICPLIFVPILFALGFAYYRYSVSFYEVGKLKFFAFDYKLDQKSHTLVSRSKDLPCKISIMYIKKGDNALYNSLQADLKQNAYGVEKVNETPWKKRMDISKETFTEVYVYEENQNYYSALFTAPSEKEYQTCQKQFEKVRNSFKLEK